MTNLSESFEKRMSAAQIDLHALKKAIDDNRQWVGHQQAHYKYGYFHLLQSLHLLFTMTMTTIMIKFFPTVMSLFFDFSDSCTIYYNAVVVVIYSRFSRR